MKGIMQQLSAIVFYTIICTQTTMQRGSRFFSTSLFEMPCSQIVRLRPLSLAKLGRPISELLDLLSLNMNGGGNARTMTFLWFPADKLPGKIITDDKRKDSNKNYKFKYIISNALPKL